LPEKGGALGGPWRIVRERRPAAELHAGSADALNSVATTGPLVRILEATAPALVLGSHQDGSLFDAEQARRSGVEVVRRRSGGSAVMVGPGRVLWVDFVIGSADRRWHDDVGRAAWWVGELWAAVVGAGAEVWKGPMQRTPWSPAVCFAGVAPGEVTVAGRKVVGVCQRRTPRAALFQTAALIDWTPEDYTSLMPSPPAEPASLGPVAAGLGDAGRLEASLVSLLLA
jgi:lipoate-protein ligase A